MLRVPQGSEGHSLDSLWVVVQVPRWEVLLAEVPRASQGFVDEL